MPPVDQTSFLRIEDLRRKYGAVAALDGIELTVHRGEFFSLLGPSGCGKTTLLRLIAGLDRPDTGKIELLGADLLAKPAEKRPVNTVFQTYALFPHLSVFANIAFGLRMRGVNRLELEERVKRVMKLVEIESLGSRKPHQLSGGQKQRAALARALVNEPQILLLDEPMAAIDLRLRKQLQTDLRDLQQRLGITFIYVTHDQEEALLMSDRVAVMNAGRIEQIGTPREIYSRPLTGFVARFLGNCNLLQGRFMQRAGGHFVECAFGTLELSDLSTALPAPGASVAVAIRAEELKLCPAGAAPNSFRACVKRIDYHGASTQVVVLLGNEQLVVTAFNIECSGLRAGVEIHVHFPVSALQLITL